jgi:hypothetical protein
LTTKDPGRIVLFYKRKMDVKMVGTFFFDLKKKRSKEETEEQRRNGI